MNKQFIDNMKQLLSFQKNELIIKCSQSQDVDMSGDETDEIQANMLLAISSQLSSRDSNKIKLIDSALLRINDNTYGYCQDCGDDIPEARLIANPHFLTCVCCAEDRERSERNRKRIQ